VPLLLTTRIVLRVSGGRAECSGRRGGVRSARARELFRRQPASARIGPDGTLRVRVGRAFAGEARHEGPNEFWVPASEPLGGERVWCSRRDRPRAW
jgi:hypothetical protein